ncbi:MAG: bifunctional acetate--CoA ligase family protein/GNAT family N-acetyltransferase [Chloroflexi bacterium]|nr:bifunctional acetate--CoA ligase family protein/GNAT family N-acetyltransferase [Chloroflexota bacterium]
MTAQPIATIPSAGYARTGPLNGLFRPHAIAVIGASERLQSVGRSVVENLIASFHAGPLWAVNPKHREVLGIPCAGTIGEVSDHIDLAVIATPAPTVPTLVKECVAKGVGGIIILSAGFRERGPEGRLLEQQVLDAIQGTPVRIIGPNCLGVMRPYSGLNATFAHGIALPGRIAFLSQSGALCTSILDWSLEERVGFSAFVSTGSMLDVGWGDLITYFGDDPHTSSIMLYLESIGNARSFMSAAREVALSKPVIVLKAGRTNAAAKAAVSHTGSLAGSEDVFEVACSRCGILQVDSIGELFSMAEVLAKQPRPLGPRLAIVTNAGGPGVLATDALVSQGGQLASLTDKTLGQLDQHLPESWSHGNPIDVLGDATPERYTDALKLALSDETSDGLLAVLTPQAMTDPTRTAEALVQVARGNQKPVLASWMGGGLVAPSVSTLNAASIPTFDHPDEAAKAFTAMWRYSDHLRSLYETPVLTPPTSPTSDPATIRGWLSEARRAGRTVLTENESKRLLQAYGITTVPTALANTAEQAVAHAELIGYPVVLKLHSSKITHKTDVGGVELHLISAETVTTAFHRIKSVVTSQLGTEAFEGVTVQKMVKHWGVELVIGSTVDAQFGPVVLFGAGGQLVEIWQDRALGLPPLNSTLAHRQIEQTKIYRALRNVRGHGPADLQALTVMLVRFSQFVATERAIREVDVNPIVLTDDGPLALDARVVLYPTEALEEDLPPLAIRPYPQHYSGVWRLRDGNSVEIRPIRPEDESLMRAFHETLSEQSIYLRFFHLMSFEQRVAHERLIRRCFIDYDREIALVADHREEDGGHAILGIGRIVKARMQPEAEFSLLVSDRYQAQGLGTELLLRLIAIARSEGLERLTGDILMENIAMRRISAELGFSLRDHSEGAIHAVLDLRQTEYPHPVEN